MTWVVVPGRDGLRVQIEDIHGRMVATELVIQNSEGITGHQVRTTPLAAIEAWANSPQGVEAIRSADGHAVVAMAAAVAAELAVPARKPYGHDFYARVANAYGSLSVRGRSPARDLAAANNVPVTTAQRWVREARRRGFLPPGAKGRAG